MYLISTAEIISALQGGGCKTDDPTVEKASGVLLMALTRVEEALETGSLSRGIFTDAFEVTDAHARSGLSEVRLVNAFLAGTPVTLASHDRPYAPGDAPDFYSLNRETGVVVYKGLPRGRYLVTYTSGFEKDDNGYAKDLPQWIKNLCMTMVLHWFRIGIISPQVPNNISYRAMVESVVREIFTRKSMRYDRPRFGMIFADRSEYGND